MIDRATIDRILDAVRIEEVVGDFVSLRKRGPNYIGLCPFHADKNPSMSVSSTKGIFKCFSCGKAGNAVSFVMEHEHKTYPEALRYLADKYHIEIKETEESPEEIAHRLKYDSLIAVSEYAQKFYQDMLWNNPTGRAVGLSYFRERRFTDETIRKFGLGYACNRPFTLSADAMVHGYKKEYLLDTGLCIERDNGEISDRFYDRVMFPIYSVSGRVIAFGGRTLRNDKTIAKYVNSPQTEIYDKSRSLYGLFQAKSAISKEDKCILVEGYADVISMHQSGICNVVASSGTSLTVEQIRLIKRFTSNITIIYDGDEPGIKAALRGTDLILEEGLNVKVVLLPPEDDPDSYAKAHDYDEIVNYISSHECDFVEFKSDILERRMGTDPIARAQMINDIIQTISVIPDTILRSVYVESVAERFNQNPDNIFQKIAEIREKKRELERRRQQYGDSGRYEPTATADAIVPSEPTGAEEPVEPSGARETQDTGYAITNAYLATQERELIYYLLKFGSFVMEFEAKPDATAEEPAHVDEYIRDSMSYDGIVFENRIYREMYDEYFAFTATLQNGTDAQDKIIRHFTNHENQRFVEQVLHLLYEDYPLTIKVFQEALEPEENTLAVQVPKSVMLYKSRITEQICANLSKDIARAQKEGDSAALKVLTARLQTLSQVKLFFAKELNRL